jgi:hypothetical protein
VLKQGIILLRHLLICIFLLSPTLSLAENINLSLSDALKRSFAYSKSLKASESALRQAEENYKKARSALFPVLNLVGSGYTQQNLQVLQTYRQVLFLHPLPPVERSLIQHLFN